MRINMTVSIRNNSSCKKNRQQGEWLVLLPFFCFLFKQKQVKTSKHRHTCTPTFTHTNVNTKDFWKARRYFQTYFFWARLNNTQEQNTFPVGSQMSEPITYHPHTNTNTHMQARTLRIPAVSDVMRTKMCSPY